MCFSLPWEHLLHSLQLLFRLPWGQMVHAAQLLFTFL
jgi:hypothetical protein|tara:strand:+ start:221 stop:331 length:111 start_codon:yes stop_codon:yes gene_type:complete